MSEAKVDANEALKQEYLQACVELGNIEYQITMLDDNLEQLRYQSEKVINKMKAINKRGAALAKGEPANEQQSNTDDAGAAVSPI